MSLHLAPVCALALALADSPSNTSAAVIATLAYEQGFEVSANLSNAADDWSWVFGGNRYGWVSNNEFAFLAIDNSTLTVAPEPARAMLISLAPLGSLALLGWLVQTLRRTSRAH